MMLELLHVLGSMLTLSKDSETGVACYVRRHRLSQGNGNP